MGQFQKLDPASTGRLSDALKRVFSYENLVHAISGATGGVVALTVFYPLDAAKTRLQVDERLKAKYTPTLIKDIVNNEGLLAVYRGLLPSAATMCSSNFIYFYTFNSLKAVLHGSNESPGPLKNLAFGFIAGVVNVLVTTPLWVTNIRLKLQGADLQTEEYKNSKRPYYTGLLDGMWKIIRFEGLRGLWRGVVPSVILCTNPAIHLMVYETLKRYVQRRLDTAELSGLMYFLLSAIAKTIATIATYPMQVIQARRRAGFKKTNRSSFPLKDIEDIIRTEGMTGLYKGMEAKLIQTVMAAALMFATYEKIAAFIFHLMGQTTHGTKKL